MHLILHARSQHDRDACGLADACQLERVLLDEVDIEFEARIKRPGIVNAMHHEGFNKAVQATGRKKQFVAGVTTEICITFPVLQMAR